MIYGNITGGLGNQLFQIFAIISYSIKNKYRFVFPEDIVYGITKRYPYWDSFLSNIKIFTTKYIPKIDVWREKGFEYNEIAPFLQENIMLCGYFQSYKYFDEYYETICRMISLDKQKMQILMEFPNDYTNKISMHFRLGDYKNLQDRHPILQYEYYKDSIQFIQLQNNNINNTNKKCLEILYFCEKEDNEEVLVIINKLKKEFPQLIFSKQLDTIEDWKQMLMMSLCQHNIIANSTFSWWGAYFNSDPNKIVCYPEKWFGPALNNKNNTKDIFPVSWCKI